MTFGGHRVSLNVASSQNVKSHCANVYKEEQFAFLSFTFLVCDIVLVCVIGIIQVGFLGTTEFSLLLSVQYWV